MYGSTIIYLICRQRAREMGKPMNDNMSVPEEILGNTVGGVSDWQGRKRWKRGTRDA